MKRGITGNQITKSENATDFNRLMNQTQAKPSRNLDEELNAAKKQLEVLQSDKRSDPIEKFYLKKKINNLEQETVEKSIAKQGSKDDFKALLDQKVNLSERPLTPRPHRRSEDAPTIEHATASLPDEPEHFNKLLHLKGQSKEKAKVAKIYKGKNGLEMKFIDGELEIASLGRKNEQEIKKVTEEITQLQNKRNPILSDPTANETALVKKLKQLEYPEAPFSQKELDLLDAVNEIPKTRLNLNESEIKLMSNIEKFIEQKSIVNNEDAIRATNFFGFKKKQEGLRQDTLNVIQKKIAKLQVQSTPTHGDLRKAFNENNITIPSGLIYKIDEAIKSQTSNLDTYDTTIRTMRDILFKFEKELKMSGKKAPKAIQFYMDRIPLYYKHLQVNRGKNLNEI